MTHAGKTAFRIVLAAIAAVLTLAGTVLVISVFWPISLSVMQPLATTLVSRTLAPLKVEVENLSFTWDPADGSVTFIATGVRLLDQNNKRVGELPYGEADLSLADMLTGRAEIKAVRLEEPRIVLAVDPGEGLSLSVGPYGPPIKQAVLKGVVLERAIAALWNCSIGPPPAVTLRNGAFAFLDQDAAVYLTFAVLDMTLQPRVLGSQVAVTSHMLVGGQRLNFYLAAQQNCRAKSLSLSLFPKAIHPAVLGEVIPGGRLLYPFEVPVSGRLDLSFGPDRSLLGLDFNLTGGAGSLEVASYAARNLSVEGLALVGSYSAALKELTLRKGRFDLEQGSVLLEGRVHRDPAGTRLALRVVFRGGELLRLLPRWFAGLRTALRKALKAEHEAGDVSLSLNGVIDDKNWIDARGSFVVPFADPGEKVKPNEKLRLDFRLDGQISAPRLVVSGQVP